MRIGLPIGVALLLVLSGAAIAQDATTGPIIGSPSTDAMDQPAVDRQAEGFHILAIGDALAGGLGAGLMRLAIEERGYDVTLRFTELSSIARPELYDWSETLPKIVEGKNFDIVVMLIGVNDRQDMRVGNFRYAFGTPDWIAAYKSQLDKVMSALKATGSAVYWVSLPPMADSDYDAAMQQVTALQKERATAASLHVVDIRKGFVDPSGAYTDRGPDETGTVRLLRGRDGVSFFKAGNNRLAQLVLAAIKADAAKPAPAPPPAPAASLPSTAAVLAAVPAQLPPPPLEPIDRPVFAQLGADGTTLTFRGDVAPAALASAGALRPVQKLAPSGSAAADLLVKGIADAAPAGRADDFTFPAK